MAEHQRGGAASYYNQPQQGNIFAQGSPAYMAGGQPQYQQRPYWQA